MTVDQIIADCEAHGIVFSCRYMPGIGKNRWCARVGSPENMRLAETLTDAVLAAWAAYTNAEGK